MNANRFEALSKTLAETRTRRGFVKGLAGTTAAALLAAGLGSRASAAGSRGGAATSGRAIGDHPDGAVIDYYLAIGARDFSTAYHIWDAGYRSTHSYADFKAGFSDTAMVDLAVLGTDDLGGGRFKVTVQVISWHTDGSINLFTGSYRVHGKTGAYRLGSGSLTDQGTPDVWPLCRASDLTGSVEGGAATGHRYGALTLTNVSDSPCYVGGFASVKVVDGHNHKVIGSKPELGTFYQAKAIGSGDSAYAQLDWTNWCGDAITPDISLSVGLPSGFGSVKIHDSFGVPPCAAGDQASYLGITPWS